MIKVGGVLVKIAYKYYKKHIKRVKKLVIYSRPLKKHFGTTFESKAVVLAGVFTGLLQKKDENRQEDFLAKTTDSKQSIT